MTTAAEIDALAWSAVLGCDPTALLRARDRSERVIRLAILHRAAAIDRERMRHQAQMIAAEVSKLFRR